MRFSIITPTYNRQELLGRVYESLCAQTLGDFEWVVVDDGSTDGTASLILQLAKEAPFPVFLLTQANAGKCAAVNRGVVRARGKFIGILDSDDWYTAEALERCWYHWELIPEDERSRFVGITALSAQVDGVVLGKRFPRDVFDSDSIDIKARYGITGDKKGFQLREVLLEYPFPELAHHTTEAIVWNRIAVRFKTRFVNEVWSYVEYQSDGLSKRSYENAIRWPKDNLTWHQELLNLERPLPLGFTISHSANLLRFALHSRDLTSFAGVPFHRVAAGSLLGGALYVRDKIVDVLRQRSVKVC